MFLGQLTHTDKTGMRISVVAIPEARLVLAESIGHQFDACSGIGDKDQIEIVGVCVEETEEL